MVILNLYGIPFHAVVVFRPEHDFLFKSASSYCVVSLLTSIILLPIYGVLPPVVLTTFSLPLALSMSSTLDFVPPIVMEMHGNLSLNCSNNEGFLSVVKVTKSQRIFSIMPHLQKNTP